MTQSVSFEGFEEYRSMTPPGLKNRLRKTDILESASGAFVPLTGSGNTIRTTPKLKDESNAFRYQRAAQIIVKNPLCYIATKTLQDEMTSANLIVEEKQGNTWTKHEDNPLEILIEEPNSEMDKNDYIRAWVTHLPNFGIAQTTVLAKGDTMWNGSRNEQDIALEIPFPTRLVKDLRAPDGNYFYQPFFMDKPKIFDKSRVISDKNYNPMNPFGGISTSQDVLDRIFEIDLFYTREISDFFEDGGMAKSILIKRIDVNKDPKDSYQINPTEIEEQIQKLYAQVNQRRVKRNIAGIRGDWDLKQLSSGLDTLLQKDLAHFIQMLISGTYGIPASLFWVGLELSNQRASREMDNIGFYERTIWNLMNRMSSKLNKHLPGLMNLKDRFRFRFDVSEMPLAQALRLQTNREKERWFQAQLIDRGRAWDMLGLPTNELTDAQKKEMYQGNKGAGANLNNGAGEQSIGANPSLA